MVEGGMKLVKYGLFLFNLFFVIAGILCIYLGISTNSRIATFDDLVNLSAYSVASKILIGVGIVMFVLAFLGCCGSVKENHFMVMTYSVLVGLILVIQIGAAVAAYYKQDDLNDLLEEKMKESLPKAGDNPELRRVWDVIQSHAECCGVKDYRDWFDVISLNVSISQKIPESCCYPQMTEGCALSVTPTTPPEEAAKKIFTTGCVVRGVEYMNIGRGATVGIILAVIELLAVVFACFMARSIRYSYETV